MIDERVSFNSGPYKLAGHFFSPDCSMSALPGIIYCGGFPGGQAGLSIASALSKDGYSVLKFDYRGMRESEGVLHFRSQADDVMAAVTYLEKRPEVESQLIGVVGHSSGGMMAIAAASKDVRIKAVAVWATIANYGLFLKLLRSRKFFFYSQWALLHKMRNEFRGNDFPRQLTNLRDMDPLSCVKKISPRPLLIIHEKDDLIMSVEHAYDLYEKAREPKKLVIGKGKMHSDADPFYSAVERDDGAIRITLDWFNNIFKNKAYLRKNPENTKLGDEK